MTRTPVWNAPLPQRHASSPTRRILLLGDGCEQDLRTAVRAAFPGCELAVAHRSASATDPAARWHLQRAAIRPTAAWGSARTGLLAAIEAANVVALLPGSTSLTRDPEVARTLHARRAPASLVWAGTPDGRPFPASTLAIIDEPAGTDPSPAADTGHLAQLADVARPLADTTPHVAMRLQAGGFLLFTRRDIRLVPCRAPVPRVPEPELPTVAAITAAVLEADHDVVAALETTTRLLAEPVVARRPMTLEPADAN